MFAGDARLTALTPVGLQPEKFSFCQRGKLVHLKKAIEVTQGMLRHFLHTCNRSHSGTL